MFLVIPDSFRSRTIEQDFASFRPTNSGFDISGTVFSRANPDERRRKQPAHPISRPSDRPGATPGRRRSGRRPCSLRMLNAIMAVPPGSGQGVAGNRVLGDSSKWSPSMRRRRGRRQLADSGVEPARSASQRLILQDSPTGEFICCQLEAGHAGFLRPPPRRSCRSRHEH